MENNAIDQYIWKGPRINDVQEKIRLVDCDRQQLQTYYDHCQKMLNNNSFKTPGRLKLIEITDDQIQKCRAELLVRWLRQERNYTYANCYEDVLALIERNKQVFNETNPSSSCPIGMIMSGIPDEYKRVPIGLVTAACTYSLGVLDVSHITLSFLVRLGIYLTKQELQTELFEQDPETGSARNRIEVLKEREGLNPALHIKVTPTGLSYAEFRTMYRMQKKDRYEKYTTQQLKILSNKILYKFQQECETQADQWRRKASEILEVAEAKGWKLEDSE